jgi:hypothetical protein
VPQPIVSERGVAMAPLMQWSSFMPMTPIQELEREIHRDRRNTVFTAVLVIMVILLVAFAWSNGR